MSRKSIQRLERILGHNIPGFQVESRQEMVMQLDVAMLAFSILYSFFALYKIKVCVAWTLEYKGRASRGHTLFSGPFLTRQSEIWVTEPVKNPVLTRSTQTECAASLMLLTNR